MRDARGALLPASVNGMDSSPFLTASTLIVRKVSVTLASCATAYINREDARMAAIAIFQLVKETNV